MTQIGCGPLERLDGPPPVAPEFGLLPAARAPRAAGVRIVDEPGYEWMNGAEIWPYPRTIPDTFSQFPQGSGDTKAFGVNPATAVFGSFTLYLPVSCTTVQAKSPDFRARAIAAFEARESAALARELLTGAQQGNLQSFLADNGPETIYPNGGGATSVTNGIALLEKEIGKVGSLGLIHVPPQVATAAREKFDAEIRDGVLRTINGNTVVNDNGYAAGANPRNHAAAAGTQDWIFASGPIDIRQGPVEVMPDELAAALDRGLGATNLRTNEITLRVERVYLVIWDTVVHAAVLVDRCQTTC